MKWFSAGHRKEWRANRQEWRARLTSLPRVHQPRHRLVNDQLSNRLGNCFNSVFWLDHRQPIDYHSVTDGWATTHPESTEYREHILNSCMNTEKVEQTTAPIRVKWWLLLFGVLPVLGTALLAGRLIWEQTVWTWRRGPQMVGFSLAHGVGAVLFFAPILLVLWTAAALVIIVIDLVKRRKLDSVTLVGFAIALTLFGLLSVPSGIWQRLFIRQMVSSPRVGDLLVYAAYDKDYRTVQAMLSHGVSVSAIDHAEWRTALHAAAISGDLRTIQLLVSMGANVNALDRSGDSPTELAASRGHQDCVAFLEEHSGVRIRGDEAQHQKAIQDKVAEDIEEMDRKRTE